MASTYSTNLKIELMGVGDQSNTWGNTNNTNLGTTLEQAIVGYGNPDFGSDADLTISLTDSNASQIARCFALNVTSSVSLSTTRNLIVPTIQKPYLIYNATSGSQSIVVKTSAGTGVTVPNGARTLVYVDGTNVVSSVSNLPTLTLNTALAVASGGTGVTTSTGTGSVVLSTSPTLVTPNLGTPSAATLTNATGLPLTTGVTGTLPVANGGTGQTTYTDGQLLIGNSTGNTLTKATLTAGTGITITNGNGSITIAGNTGTVTSVSGTGTVNGITLTGTVTSSGSLTLGGTLSGVSLTTQVTGTLPVANGGTGVTSSTGSGAVVLSTSPTLTTPNLGTPSAATLTNATGLPLTTGVTGTLPVGNGGTGVTSSTGTGSVVLSASPALTGTPTAPTAALSTNTTQVATTAFVQAALQAVYPVGSIYCNATNSTNPGTLLGFGTWTAFGAGRVMVGLDAGNAAFDTAEETGGSANATLVSHTHTATVTDPGHNHTVQGTAAAANGQYTVPPSTSSAIVTTSTNTTGITVSNSTEGSSATNANLQPYIVVYMWKRTA